MLEKVVLVTRRTRLEELVQRFNTRGQARFYIEHSGGDFAEYEREHDAYQRSLEVTEQALELGLPRQLLDRALLPTYAFSDRDLVVALGQDGLVANTAKYVGVQPLIGVNPDPERNDGVLLPFLPGGVRAAAEAAIEGRVAVRRVTLAEAVLNDGQRLLAFNDLFLGLRGHASARYRIQVAGQTEEQSSSGVLVSTGAGSTGWMSSVFNMAAGVAALTGGSVGGALRLDWESPELLFAVREPFASRHSAASVVAGRLEAGAELVVESHMPAGGVVFSDGVEADFLRFESGATARVRAADHRAHLVVAPEQAQAQR
jgi:NAD kinase